MSKKDLKGACVLVHIPEEDGGYKKQLLTLAELAELLQPEPAEEPAPEAAPAEKEATPEEAPEVAPAPAKKKRRSTRKKE